MASWDVLFNNHGQPPRALCRMRCPVPAVRTHGANAAVADDLA
jgi:hypothetical protein